MNRDNGYHVVHDGTSMTVFPTDGRTHEPDKKAAAYALRPGQPRMFVELWEAGARVRVWHPNDISLSGGVPRLT